MEQTKRLSQAMIDYVYQHPQTSFAELEQLFDHYQFDWHGKTLLSSPDYANLCYWSDWNQTAIELLNTALKQGKLNMQTTAPVIYLIDGKSLNLPIASKQRSYKKLHWLPVTIYAGKRFTHA